jgi:DNA-binding transcriptional MerR regulator
MAMTQTKSTYRSGELAALAGISADTLRYYERRGVLPAPHRTQAGYRVYSPQAAQRVALIRSALSIGFSIDELAGILRQRDRGQTPCRQVHQLAKEKLSALEQELCELQALKRNLQTIVHSWDSKLAKTAAGQPARLLETLKPIRRTARRNLHRQKSA